MLWSLLLFFFNEEYLIALVDFIAPCGGTKEWGRRDLRIPPSPPSGLPPFQPWGIAAAGYWAAAGLQGCRIPVSGAIARRHFDVVFGCFVFGSVSFAFQSVLLGLFRLLFIIGWEKDAACVSFLLVFLITADRDYCFNFVWCKSISPNRLGRSILEKCVRAV